MFTNLNKTPSFNYTHDQQLIQTKDWLSLYKTSFYYNNQITSWIYHVVCKDTGILFSFDEKAEALSKIDELLFYGKDSSNVVPLFERNDIAEDYESYDSI